MHDCVTKRDIDSGINNEEDYCFLSSSVSQVSQRNEYPSLHELLKADFLL